MKKYFTVIFLVVILLPTYSIAQSDVLESTLQTNKLAFMTGEWEGEGWSMTRSGKETSKVTEKVECKLACNILVVTGQGTKKNPETNETNIVHDAFGVITYDPLTGKYMIRAYKTDNVVETEIIFLEEKLFQWQIPAPGGTVRFTVDFRQPDTWKETGEYSRDGMNWMKSMEMELKRKN